MALLFNNHYIVQKNLRSNNNTLILASYWTSREYSSTNALAFSFTVGLLSSYDKVVLTQPKVRGVKSF